MFGNSSASNRVVDNALSIWYTVEKVINQTQNSVWCKVVRHAAKTYHYCDLTPIAAAIVQARKVTKYTRTTRNCISSSEDVYSETLTTDISTSLNSNGSYNVNITVNETDSTHSASIPLDPSALFSAENGRDYDEEDGEITVSASRQELGSPYGWRYYIYVYVSGEFVGSSPYDVKIYSDTGANMGTPATYSKTSYRLDTVKSQRIDNGYVKIGDVTANWSISE